MPRKLTFILSLILLTHISHGKTTDSLFLDNNPKITDAEAEWLNKNFPFHNFDYTGKYIRFTELVAGGYWWIGKWTFDMKKKNLDTLSLDKRIYRVFILDSNEKETTRGFDAMLVIAKKGIKGKLRRLTKDKALELTLNRYPQIPPDAGKDNNAILSESNAIFFNELYRAELYPDTSYDFRGKKVAIYDTHCLRAEMERLSIPEYVKKVKLQLDDLGFSMADIKYVLSEEQKKESGGYDVIIQLHNCKKMPPVKYAIEYLKTNQ